MVIYVGAAVMYIIGKRLKKRHNLLDDARQSLYGEVNYFLKTITAKGTSFIGGDEPNLADLAVFGCISSIDGIFWITTYVLVLKILVMLRHFGNSLELILKLLTRHAHVWRPHAEYPTFPLVNYITRC